MVAADTFYGLLSIGALMAVAETAEPYVLSWKLSNVAGNMGETRAVSRPSSEFMVASAIAEQDVLHPAGEDRGRGAGDPLSSKHCLQLSEAARSRKRRDRLQLQRRPALCPAKRGPVDAAVQTWLTEMPELAAFRCTRHTRSGRSKLPPSGLIEETRWAYCARCRAKRQSGSSQQVLQEISRNWWKAYQWRPWSKWRQLTNEAVKTFGLGGSQLREAALDGDKSKARACGNEGDGGETSGVIGWKSLIRRLFQPRPCLPHRPDVRDRCPRASLFERVWERRSLYEGRAGLAVIKKVARGNVHPRFLPFLKWLRRKPCQKVAALLVDFREFVSWRPATNFVQTSRLVLRSCQTQCCG